MAIGMASFLLISFMCICCLSHTISKVSADLTSIKKTPQYEEYKELME